MEQKERINLILLHSNVCFLLGAGSSVNKINGKVAFPLMSDLLEAVKSDSGITDFYQYLSAETKSDMDQYGMIKSLFDKYVFSGMANIETFLSSVDCIEEYISNDEFKKRVAECRDQIRDRIKKRIKESDTNTAIEIYKRFYNALHHLREVSSDSSKTINVFTTNYDMLNELAMEDLGIHYYSGFYGISKRRFNISYYDHEFVNTHKIKNAHYIVDNHHINLYKLHGSLSWSISEDTGELLEKNPFDLDFTPEIIYPSSSKFHRTNSIIFYSALMREFSDKICQENTTLVVSGTSLGDEHINKLIENALSIPTFTLLIFGHSNSQITNLKEKYSQFPNVVVCDEPKSFEEVADVIVNIEVKR